MLSNRFGCHLTNTRILRQTLHRQLATHLQQRPVSQQLQRILLHTAAVSRPKFISITLTSRQHHVMAASGSFNLNEIEGDLFSAPQTYSLAHCVGGDFAMGAGIAVKFKQIYGQVSELLAQGAKTGGVAVLQDKERYIYYLVTKPYSWDKPTYDSLRSSLIAMRGHMRANGVHKLAIPRIGCGIDGLEWDKVSNELKQVFGSEDLEITVYNFVPK